MDFALGFTADREKDRTVQYSTGQDRIVQDSTGQDRTVLESIRSTIRLIMKQTIKLCVDSTIT